VSWRWRGGHEADEGQLRYLRYAIDLGIKAGANTGQSCAIPLQVLMVHESAENSEFGIEGSPDAITAKYRFPVEERLGLKEAHAADNSGVSRRNFVLAAAAASGAAGGQAQIAAPTLAIRSPSLLEMSAVDAVAAMQSGDLKAERYVLALLEQCKRGKALNAFITLDRERVLAAARAADQRRKSGAKLGPLHGLPIPIKDSINTSDLPTTGGTAALRAFRPKEDAPIVRKLRNAGAIVLGKSNLHELSLGWTSNNQAFGAVHNPYDPTRIPGGSSGGTATAVAARMAPLGVAEDTMSSIRIPAALCGISGYRPTTGRYPSAGVAPITELFDHVGPHARTVGDLSLFDAVATGDFRAIRPAALNGTKLGVGREYWFAGLHAEVERITDAALRKLQSAGVELVQEEVPNLANLIERTTVPVIFHDVLRTLPKYLQDSGAEMTFNQVVELTAPKLKALFALLRKGGSLFVSEEIYRAALNIYLPQLRKNFREYFARTGVAAIVFPVTMVPATLIGIGEDQEVTIGKEKVPFSTAIFTQYRARQHGRTSGAGAACGADVERITGVAGVRWSVRNGPIPAVVRVECRTRARPSATAEDVSDLPYQDHGRIEQPIVSGGDNYG
jgi:indoleacetamide hydrolase